MTELPWDAVILAGGRSTRMGTSKAHLVVQGRSLAERAVDACADARTVVVVGEPVPALQARGVLFTREEPAYGGPTAGIKAGLAALPRDESDCGGRGGAMVLVVACDVPGLAEGLPLLHAAARDQLASDADGVCLVDEEGYVQWLFGLYRVDALAQALAGDVTNVSVRSRLGGLSVVHVAAPMRITGDLDTPDDLHNWLTPPP